MDKAHSSGGFDACLLIFLPKTAQNSGTRSCVVADTAPDTEAEQAIAMAAALHHSGTKLLLLCRANSWIFREASRLNLPYLAVNTRSNPLLLIKLWFWQRKQESLLIQTIGEGSMALGRLVTSWRKQATTLAHAFFVCPPSHPFTQNRALWAAQKIFCGNGIIRGELTKADPGDVKNRLVLLAPGIDTDKYIPPDGLPVKKTYEDCLVPGTRGTQHFIFGMNCGLAARSGVLVVVRAMAAMWQVEGLPPWEVRIIGSGRRFTEVLAEAEQLGVSSRLCLLGDQTAPDFLAACHAWLAPGISTQERPEALWAGFAAGLPVICSQSSLHAERLAGRNAALMVKPHDPQALAGAMIELMTNAVLRQNLIERTVTLRERWEMGRMTKEALHSFSIWAKPHSDNNTSEIMHRTAKKHGST